MALDGGEVNVVGFGDWGLVIKHLTTKVLI
jgi:hypothetical protein